ncbi:hypothetical protein M0E87_01460 [Corynebacterium sp. CCM 9185]|uniref:DUF2273 domain-containing protein n=1 Tax=Corynebacterium marambiense TaxID=2765364 RepID=A0ABS0VRU5_9CORY|nr:hypothetical protein [Corynebacterium marambiense]MBI8999503.1 hypothetical protein [Corynebacterium marambiense]MCK7662341.1 hypothetical protein [Corynebacterium marambiense]MCX7541610.1 hypothetical protein [Corynebacterium marambiense]
MKSLTVIGLILGFAFAFAVIVGGLVGFLWALLFVTVGGVIGAHFDGKIDLRAIINGSSNRG